MNKLIEKYTQLNGASGQESEIKNSLKATFENLINKNNNCKIYEDKLGSVGLYIDNKAEKTIAIMSHLDEVGLLVRGIDKDGIVSVVPVGGLTVDFLISQRVVFKNEKGEEYIGVVLSSSPHIKDTKEKTIKDLRVSFGVNSKEELENLGIECGSYLNFIGEFIQSPNNQIIAKALDNRIGVSAVHYLAEQYASKSQKVNIFLGATVQEEVGTRGISPLIHALDFKVDEMYIVDVSPIDGMEEYKLGAGPLLRMTEPRVVYSTELISKIQNLANVDVPYQNYFAVGGTDARTAQITKDGFKTTAICIPALNLHTNSSIAHMDDINNMLKLFERIIEDEK